MRWFHLVIVFLLVMLLMVSVQGQEDVIFQDDFSDNANDWETINNETYFSDVVDGKYQISMVTDSSYWTRTWLVGPGFTDWSKAPILSGSYEFSFTVSGVSTERGIVCVSGLIDLQESYGGFTLIYICSNGLISFRQGDQYDEYRVDGYDLLSGENKITIQVIDNIYTVLINDEQQAQSTSFGPTNGSIGIGLRVNSGDRHATKASATFDNIVVKGLDESASQEIAGEQAAAANVCADAISSAIAAVEPRTGETLLFAEDFSSNCNNWVVERGGQEAVIEDGQLYVEIDGNIPSVFGPSRNKLDEAPKFMGDYVFEFTLSEWAADENTCLRIVFAHLSFAREKKLSLCLNGVSILGVRGSDYEQYFNSVDFTTGEHRFRVEVLESEATFTVFIDGQEAVAYRDRWRDEELGGIALGLAWDGSTVGSGYAKFDDVAVWRINDEADVVEATPATSNDTISILPEDAVKTVLSIEDFSDNSARWEMHSDNRYISNIDDGRLRVEVRNGQEWIVPAGSNLRSVAPSAAGEYEVEYTISSFEADTAQACLVFMFDLRKGDNANRLDFCQDGTWSHIESDVVTTGTYVAPDFSDGPHQVRVQITLSSYTLIIDDVPVIQISPVLPTRGTFALGIARASNGPGTINAAVEFDDFIIRLFERGRRVMENNEGEEILETQDGPIKVLTTGDYIEGETVAGAVNCDGHDYQEFHLYYGYEGHPVSMVMTRNPYLTDPDYEPPMGRFAIVDVETNDFLASSTPEIRFGSLQVVLSLRNFSVPADGFYGLFTGAGDGYGCLGYDLWVFEESE